MPPLSRSLRRYNPDQVQRVGASPLSRCSIRHPLEHSFPYSLMPLIRQVKVVKNCHPCLLSTRPFLDFGRPVSAKVAQLCRLRKRLLFRGVDDSSIVRSFDIVVFLS